MSAFADEPYVEMELRYTGGQYQNEPFKYRLMKPDHVESGEQYPLVVFLHGAGERGTDNAKQLSYLPRILADDDHRRDFPCFVLAPQCPSGQQWVDVPWSDVMPSPIKPESTDPLKAVILMLQKTMKENPIDADRVYLTGLSMGGYGAWELAARHPEWFAALAPICGGGDPATAAKLQSLPIWAFHGGNDSVVPPQRSRLMVNVLKAVDGNIKYTEYPGVGHNSWNKAYARSSGLMGWMFQQRRPSNN